LITEPTVLVLGAGASSDYGFPLGRKLRDLVCALPRTAAEESIQQAGFAESEIRDFVETLQYSGFGSVDWFLENRPEFLAVGKACIGAALIPFENPEKLFPPGAPENHWYELLLNVLDEPLGSIGSSPVSIITFNYDRSLEYYLFKAVATRVQSETRARELLEALPIVHVHGQLGALLPLTGRGRDYIPFVRAEDIVLAMKEISIVAEASPETLEFRRAKALLESAKRVDFLGFSYHPESVKRLGIFNEPWTDIERNRIRVRGTSRKIPAHRWEYIRSTILNGAIPSAHRRVNPVFSYLNEAEPLDETAL
tara:strand:+ start:64 stop:993 length:930 start_codon:yes stop_codon:yes gene_type:complete